jgi:polyisoprenoid-binding protein YceI
MLRNVKRTATCTLVWLAAYSASLAAQPAAGDVDTKTSRVYILVDKTGLGHPHGVEGRLRSGSIKLDTNSNAGQIVFDMTTFVADTDEARKYVGLSGSTSDSTKKQVNDNMLGADVLDVKSHPTATFDVDSAMPLAKKSAAGNPLYRLRGTFHLRGASQPLTVDAEAIAKGNATRLHGRFTIQQTKFGMKPYTAVLGTVGVADALTISGEIDIAK